MESVRYGLDIPWRPRILSSYILYDLYNAIIIMHELCCRDIGFKLFIGGLSWGVSEGTFLDYIFIGFTT